MAQGVLSETRQSVLDHRIVRDIRRGLRVISYDKTTLFYGSSLVFILLLGLVGPEIAPYHYEATQYQNGELLRNAPPSLEHPLGTNNYGYDILSRVLYGARPTVETGLIGGTLIIGIGATIGLVSGYMGGWVDSILMRFTDMMYSVPVLPFALVIIAFIGVGFYKSLIVLGVILWRGNARVIRSQVLQIKQEPYILALESNGAGNTRIIVKHILPNVAPMAILFFAIGIGVSILIQASLAFLGFSNPFLPSWGVMVRNAFDAGLTSSAWWWSMPPGLLIAWTVLSTFMFGRNYEELIEAESDQEIATAG